MFSKILMIGWLFTAGWCPLDNTGFGRHVFESRESSGLDLYSNTMHTGMAFNAVILEHLNLRGRIDTWQYPQKLTSWSPYRVQYTIGADLSLFSFYDKKFNMLLSIDRYCEHPGTAWGMTSGQLNRAYCEVSLTVRGTADIF